MLRALPLISLVERDGMDYTASSGAGVVNLATLGWLETLACGPPVTGAWCSSAATTITRTVLTEAGNGSLGVAHPSVPNTTIVGYQLTQPTNLDGPDTVQRTRSGRARNRPKPSL